MSRRPLVSVLFALIVAGATFGGAAAEKSETAIPHALQDWQT